YLIVSDSSANIFKLTDVNYKTVPLHVMLGEENWADKPEVDLSVFDKVLDSFKGKTSSSCPSPNEWLESFGDAEIVFCLTISNGLSGSYNSAVTAKHMYEEQYPERRVYIVDSLGAGARQTLILYYMSDLLKSGMDPDEVYKKALEYRDRSGILYTLESLQMLASAGRCSPIVAKAIGVLDIRVIGTASAEGTIVIADKARGYKRALMATFKQMLNDGFEGGKVVICHNRNEQAAKDLAELIRNKFGDVMIDIHRAAVLCSYYAEKGGYIIGYERGRVNGDGTL
ncbi:MAG: DegV family protein, partial [Eubacteriales bacterium]|nr:DegV family protein [Eubacteriales bacterium]